MLEGIPKISALVITYNQEDVISRAIDSLLCQRDYIYEICVSDDCSKDKTWEILQKYSNNNPDLFKLNRNEPNSGIFENIEKVKEMSSGDIIYLMAGDDKCGDGWFKTVVDYIKEKNLDYKTGLFCIYGNYRAIYPNGDSFVQDNGMILSGKSPLKLGIRGLICNRSACYTKNVDIKFKKVSQGKSYIAEGAQDRQLQMWSHSNYYIPVVGNNYFTGIGVSAHLNSERKKMRLARWDYLVSFLKSEGFMLDPKDINYIEYCKRKESSQRIQTLLFFIKSIDLSLGLKGVQIKRYIFALLRKLPHNKPIVDFKV